MRNPLRASLAALLLTASLAAQARPIDTDIHHYVSKLQDFSAGFIVINADLRELGKISKDGTFIYRFKDIKVQYKEPNKIRIDGSLEGARGLFVMNGSEQWVSVPRLRIKTHQDYGKAPGKRKSLMEVGLISSYYLSYTDAKFIREATVDGTPCAVFEMRFKDPDERDSHQTIYIDPKTKVILRHEAYSFTGKLQAVYFYKDVKEVAPGVWFPTRVEARNADNVVAGVTGYKDIKVNQDLPDSLFRL